MPLQEAHLRIMKKLQLALAVLMPVAVVLAGCGGTTDADSAAIESTIEGFYSAFNAQDWSKCAGYVDDSQNWGASTIRSALQMSYAVTGRVTVETITNIDISGSTATAEVGLTYGGESETMELPLTKKDGRWKISWQSAEVSRPTTVYGLGETVTIGDTYLTRLHGRPKPVGNLDVVFGSAERATSVEDHFTGQGPQTPKGVFIAVYYCLTNNLNSGFQPSTQLNDCLLLKDDRGRQWEKIDYTGNHIARSADFAVAKGMDQPEADVGAGFSACTAIAFDVPVNATGLHLFSEQFGIEVTLNLG